MNIFQITFLLIFLAFILRFISIKLWGNKVFEKGLRGDASIHYVIIRDIKRKNNSNFIDNYLISPEPISYPRLFHRFASFFGLKNISIRPWLPNLTINLISIFLIIFLNWRINNGSPLILLISALFFFISPSNLLFYGPNIAYLGLSERYFARITCSFAYLGFTLGILQKDTILILMGLIFGGITLSSSIFARQALIFCLPLFSLLIFDFNPVIIFLGSVLISILISKKEIINGYKHTFMTWFLYKSHTKKGTVAKEALLKFFKWEFKKEKNILKQLIGNFIEKDPTRIFFWYPEVIFIIILSLANFEDLGFLLKIILPVIVIYLITLSETFNHLGEAYRYIEYNLSLASPLLLAFLYQDGYIKNISIIYYFCFTISYIIYRSFTQFLYLKRSKNTIKDDLINLISNIEIQDDAIIFPVSMRLGGDLVARKKNWKTFWWQPGIISEYIYDEFIEEYPYLKKDWKPLAKKYNVTHIISSKEDLETIKLWKYDFSDQELIYEDKKYIVYNVNNI